MSDDKYRGKGGSYVLVDGKRIPAAEVKAAKPKKKSEQVPAPETTPKEETE